MKKYVLASHLAQCAADKLSLLGYETVDFKFNPSISSEVCYHADLSFFDCGDGTIFIAKEMFEYRRFLENLGYDVRILNKNLGDKYPHDVPLNCVFTGEYLICNIETVDLDLLQYFKLKNIKIIDVHQGYTKCSVLPVSERALITDDVAIGEKCREHGLDVLIVKKGSVCLDGFDYGFIGGASGRLNDSLIVFNGDITQHAQGAYIVDFLQKYNMDVVSLSDSRLYDIGSIIPLYERRENDEKK